MRPAVADYSTRPIVNLATNPSFETTWGTVEVWRNYMLNPLPTSAAGYISVNSAAISFDTDHLLVQCSPGVLDSGINLRSSFPVTMGEVYTISCEVEGVVGGSWRFSAQGAGFSGTSGSPEIPVAVGETKRISFTVTAVATGTSVFYLLRRHPANSEAVKVRRIMLVKSQTSPPFFAPGQPSPDPDLTPSWVGGENSSESVLSGVGLSGTGGDTFRKVFSSQQWAGSGSRSVRVLSLDGISTGWGVIANNLPNQDGQMYTVLAKCRTLTARNVQLRVDRSGMAGVTLYQGSVNGEAILRGTYTGSSAGTSARLVQGGFATSGIGDSTWWDEAMIVEGVYLGGFRYGDSPGWRWQGASHQSASSGPGGP